MGLNEKQRVAVLHTEGPMLILAGAGSGKTTVLVNRIQHMVENKGIHPGRILAVTFTNKAANEMKERVSRTVWHEDVSAIWVSTFHSLCLRILRREAGRVAGIPVNFSIYTPADAKELLKQIIRDAGYTPTKAARDKDKLYVKPDTIFGYISMMKNEMIDVESFLSGRPSNELIDWEKARTVMSTIGDEELELLIELYPEYQKRLREYGGFDFDDLMLETVKLFIRYPGLLGQYQERFGYIMVDEYQDTNHVQYSLMKMLAAKHRNIAVVGDDFQSIYAFRGSDIRNILHFDREYPEAKVVKLEQNYRSTKVIIQAANEIIARNEKQKKKVLFTENPEGDKITLCTVRHALDEADYVAGTIESLIRSGDMSQSSDAAILYRSNAQSGMMEAALAARGIPYKIYGGMSFFDRAEIRDMIAYLQFIEHPNDRVQFARIVNQPKRDVGEKTIEKILDAAGERSILSAIEDLQGLQRVSSKAKTGLTSFGVLIRKYREMSKRIGVSSLLSQLVKEIRYKEEVFAGEDKQKRKEKEENLEQFILMAKQKEEQMGGRLTISEFLQDVVVHTDSSENGERDAVKLMTIHASKGLEFPVVFLLGMKEKGFPSPHSVTEEELEEERRLCYVAFTRAMLRLYLLYPSETSVRKKHGWETSGNSPSRFLYEFSSSLVKPVDYGLKW